MLERPISVVSGFALRRTMETLGIITKPLNPGLRALGGYIVERSFERPPLINPDDPSFAFIGGRESDLPDLKPQPAPETDLD